jgi:serine/threonine protein kinase
MPSAISRLFPSMHTLSQLSGIEDKERFCGKLTTHFKDDVGIFCQNSVHIGHGSQFDVRRASHCCDRGSYVVKSAMSAAFRKGSKWRRYESTKKKGTAPEDEERLIRAVFLEYRALSHPPIKQHPNIVNLLDLGWETDPEHWDVKWPVLILEYADQGTMTGFLAQSKFSLATKAKLCLDIGRGLQVLHESGIIHGDLKMDNVLVFTNAGEPAGSIDRLPRSSRTSEPL